MRNASARTCSTNYFQWLTLGSWYTNLQQTPLNRCQQVPALQKTYPRRKRNRQTDPALTDRSD